MIRGSWVEILLYFLLASTVIVYIVSIVMASIIIICMCCMVASMSMGVRIWSILILHLSFFSLYFSLYLGIFVCIMISSYMFFFLGLYDVMAINKSMYTATPIPIRLVLICYNLMSYFIRLLIFEMMLLII